MIVNVKSGDTFVTNNLFQNGEVPVEFQGVLPITYMVKEVDNCNSPNKPPDGYNFKRRQSGFPV